jgi:hypothetical protein
MVALFAVSAVIAAGAAAGKIITNVAANKIHEKLHKPTPEDEAREEVMKHLGGILHVMKTRSCDGNCEECGEGNETNTASDGEKPAAE